MVLFILVCKIQLSQVKQTLFYYSSVQIKAEDRFVRTEQGLLIRTLNKKDSGTYVCQAVEHGFMQTLLKVTLEVIDTERLDDLIHRDDETTTHTAATHTTPWDTPPARESPNQKLWYRDFLSLVNHPTLNSVDEFCEQVWKREKKQRRQKAHLSQQVQLHQQQQGLVHAHTHVNAHGLAAKWKHLQERQKGRNRRTHELERAPRSV